MTRDLRLTLKEINKYPHTLIELSISEFNDYENNSILVRGLTREFNKGSKTYVPSYDSVTFGSNLEKGSVNFQKDNNRKQHMHRIDMSRMSKTYIFILGRKEELMEVFNNVTIFASNMKEKLDNNDKKQKGSVVCTPHFHAPPSTPHT